MDNKKRFDIIKIFYRNKNIFNTELIFSSSFECLVSVILSAKSTDIRVNQATKKLYAIANNPKDILSLGLIRLTSYINSIGLYNSKAKNIINLCTILVNQYQGNIPNDRIKLERLPGVGRKTANVVLNLIFNWSTIAVDTHVFRVSNRIGIVTGKTVLEVERKLLSYIPMYFIEYVHYWFIHHGRYVCISRKPKCNICCVRCLCEFNNKII
ncbi:endonuclease III [Buchnera aphidicola (Formosaphis micheliae)]|uniref:endonuclease III n=1 Tax=Buchnera aphidicola TaxID=9 RepID=UPI0031CCA34F